MAVQQLKKCFQDGHDIAEDSETFTFPIEMTQAKTILSPLIFCSLECVKAFLCKNALLHANRLEMFCSYIFKKYAIEDNIFPNPDPITLNAFRSDNQGITIEEFRKNNRFHTFGVQTATFSQCIATDENQETVQETTILKLDVSSKKLDDQYKMVIHTDDERGSKEIEIKTNIAETPQNKRAHVDEKKQEEPNEQFLEKKKRSSYEISLKNLNI